jgi:class 3 adenylate cyclase
MKLHQLILFSLFFVLPIAAAEYDEDLNAYEITEEEFSATLDDLSEYIGDKYLIQRLENIAEWEPFGDLELPDVFESEWIWVRYIYDPDAFMSDDEDSIKLDEPVLFVKNYGNDITLFHNGIQLEFEAKETGSLMFHYIPFDKLKSGDLLLFKLSSVPYSEFGIYITDRIVAEANPSLLAMNEIYIARYDIIVSILMILSGLASIIIFFFTDKKKNRYLLWFGIYALLLGIFKILTTDVIISFISLIPMYKEVIEMVLFDSLSIILLIFYISFFKDKWTTFFRIFMGLHFLLLIVNIAGNTTGYFKFEREILSYLLPTFEYLFILLHLFLKVRTVFPARYFMAAFLVKALTYFLQLDFIFGSTITDVALNLGLFIFFLILGIIPIVSFMRQSATIREQNIIFQKFVPKEFLQFLSKDSITQINLGDQIETDMTIMFADIRSFTPLSEKLTSEELFSKLNTYFELVGPVIRKHGGFIDKYIGDAVMALFPGSVDEAVNAAAEMHSVIEQHDEIEFKIGIGIHTGKVMLGIIGESERIESTAISDTVNIASRLEELTKKFKLPIIFSRAVYEALETDDASYVAKGKVRGKEEVLEMYTLSSVKYKEESTDSHN